jgi:hypothetical protein
VLRIPVSNQEAQEIEWAQDILKGKRQAEQDAHLFQLANSNLNQRLTEQTTLAENLRWRVSALRAGIVVMSIISLMVGALAHSLWVKWWSF